MSKVKKSRTSTSELVLFFTIFIFLLVAPFHKGLFNGNGLWNGFYSNSFAFENPIYGALQWTSIILIVVSLLLFVKWKSNESSDLFAILVWLIPLSYFVSTFQAAAMHAHSLSILIHLGYAALFVAGMWLAKNQQVSKWLIGSMIGTGYIIILFGLFNLFGDAALGGLFEYHDGQAVSRIYPHSVLIEGRGLRLTSVFQYANTYAAFLLAMILSSLALLVSARKNWIVLLSSFMLVPALLSLLLTQSRGGLVVLPVLFVIVLFFMTVKRQLMTIIQLIVPSILAIVILQPVNEWALALQDEFSRSLFFRSWGVVLAASLSAAGIAYVIERYVSPLVHRRTSKIEKMKASNVFLPVLIILAAVLGGLMLFGDSDLIQVLPDSLEQRLSAIELQTHSVLERATFYANAIELIKDYPVFGAGGGAWSALYETYQTNPYTSRQAHNFFLQYMIETGIVGFAILAGFILWIVYFFMREYWRKEEPARLTGLLYFIIALSILVHSAIDFNMSYVYIGALVFLCLGGMAAWSNRPASAFQDKWIKPAVRKVYPSMLIAAAIVMFIFSSRFAQANHLYQQSIQLLADQQPIKEIVQPLEAAIEVKKHPDYLNFKTALYSQAYAQTDDLDYYDRAEETIEQLLHEMPYNKIALYQAYNLHVMHQRLDEALKAVEIGLKYFPWEISFYERAMILHYQIGKYQIEDQPEHESSIIALYENILKKQAHLDSLPEAQLRGRAFELSKDMALILGEIYEKRGEYENAVQVIEPLLDRSLQEDVDVALARFYLAAKLQLGQEDRELYEQIEKHHPELIRQIQNLIN